MIYPFIPNNSLNIGLNKRLNQFMQRLASSTIVIFAVLTSAEKAETVILFDMFYYSMSIALSIS